MMSRETKDAVKEPTRRPPWARRKPKWDRQPTQSSAVLIATVGVPIPPTVIRRAMELGGGRPVAVISIARIYGSSLGLPNPGLMPTRKEMDEQRELVAKAIDRLEQSGIEAWGQVATTRRYARTIAQAAQARGVERVLVVTPKAARWRQVVEGDTAKDVTRRIRRLKRDIEVEGITV
jgi:hypothetical protein